MPSRSRPGLTASLLLVTALFSVLAGAFAGGAAGYFFATRQVTGPGLSPIAGVQPKTTQASPQAKTAPGEVQLRLTEENAVIEAANKVGPSTVTVINTVADRRTRFGQQLAQTSLGSGVIVDSRGYVLTNEHVIRGTKDLSVVLASGEQYPARLVGTDLPFTDLAVIKIDPPGDLVVAEMGDSENLVPGQRVVAIGSALGDFRNSITQGIISGLRRVSPAASADGTPMEDLIQTDAAINHGNSGGALVNSLGQVIGINTSVIRTTQSGQVVEGIGFAIPSNTASLVAQQLIQSGKVTRPYIGVSQHQTITRQLATFYGLPADAGVYVLTVAPGSPAAAAGLQEGDIITKIGQFELSETRPYLSTLMRFRPGEQVELTIFRGNRQQLVTVTLTER